VHLEYLASQSEAVAQTCSNIFSMDEICIQVQIPDKPEKLSLKTLTLIPFFCRSGNWVM
jgi:hypothetical protein